jgi:predicted nuclease of predicted toxin-antitoxin system
MKILLDENLPTKLRVEFGKNHEVFTVGFMGWSGKKNGELLGLMVYHGFEALVTLDKNIPFQQNVEKFPIRYFVLDAEENRISTLQPYILVLQKILEDEIEDKVIVVKI